MFDVVRPTVTVTISQLSNLFLAFIINVHKLENMTEWTRSETLRFIELWQQFPCLWNRKNSDYRHRQKRNEALQYLAEQMGTDVNPIEKKMISLKTQFNRENNKLKAQLAAGDEPATNWYAYEYLLFLKDPLMLTEDDVLDGNDIVHIPETHIQQQPQPGKILKRKRYSQSGLFNLKNTSISNTDKEKEKKDEFTIFGENIATELREIKSKRHILILKKEIMDLVFKTKLEILDKE